MQGLATLGRTTIKTVWMQACPESGGSRTYTSRCDASPALGGSPFFPSGSLSGAVVVMLGTDSFANSHEIVVESPPGQDDLETIERTLAQLTWVRDALRRTAAV